MNKQTTERKTDVQSFVEKQEDKLKILTIPLGDDGISWYRIRQPLSKLKKHDLAIIHEIDEKNDDPELIGQAIKLSDVIMGRQILNTHNTLYDIIWQIDPHKPIVYDSDDNTFIVSPYNEHYGQFGTEEFHDGTQKLWEHGKAGFDIYRNMKRVAEHRKMLDLSPVISTTTQHLREFFLKFNETVVILPNCINFDHWWRVPFKRTDGEIRILWHGGVSHYEDIHSIHKALKSILNRYQNVKLIMAGTHFPGLFKDIPEYRIESYGWIPFLAHPYRLNCLRPDIGIAPLTDTEFNKNKSEIKYSEYSALGIPTVAKNIPPYSPVIKHGESGFLYNSEEEFEEQVSKLIEDAMLRIDVGERAYRWVKANRDADGMVHLWYDTFKQLKDIRERFDGEVEGDG